MTTTTFAFNNAWAYRHHAQITVLAQAMQSDGTASQVMQTKAFHDLRDAHGGDVKLRSFATAIKNRIHCSER